jgi:hypothetical protein
VTWTWLSRKNMAILAVSAVVEFLVELRQEIGAAGEIQWISLAESDGFIFQGLRWLSF